MKNLTFGKFFFNWLIFDLILLFINAFTLNSTLVIRLLQSTLGIYLLLFPIYPKMLERYGDERTCKLCIRVIAVAEIIASFLVPVLVPSIL